MNVALEVKVDKNDDWLKPVYKSLTSDGKRQLREAFIVASDDIERGTVLRLRKNTGLNFSIAPQTKEQEKSETETKNEEFAKENTIQVPDKKKI